MKTELDKIKSTITISLGTKNRLRKLKGSQSYENFISYLVRTRNQVAHNPTNSIEFQKHERVKALYRFEMNKIIKNSPDTYAVLFSYNKYTDSPNFWFDIKIESIRDNMGREISIPDFVKEIYLEILSPKQNLLTEYKVYFGLIETAIQKEIDPQFHHKCRIEDYYLWNEEFKILNLPKKSFEEDVMDKLNDFNSGMGVFS